MLRYHKYFIPCRNIDIDIDIDETREITYKELSEYYLYSIRLSLCGSYAFYCVYEKCDYCLCRDDNKPQLIKYLQNVNFGDKSYD